MPSRERKALLDIRDHIVQATSFLEGFDYRRFVDDQRTFHAVTRCLEIISEASRRVSAETKESSPEISWEAMAAAGNIYRHEYDGVAHSRVWATVHNELPVLAAFVERQLGVQQR